ncbi:hypothetical protein HMPREF3213_00611 [Heyndrickxia coagulans]|uniref:Uncharacterized protein n=1 Tax=Heyndrickxia coagulans TaxID=1398 RepID=A0A133L0E4_HEYCO|nr:hypothetical protein HMPREF3213_00611 [Heyndrickxia coagulans]
MLRKQSEFSPLLNVERLYVKEAAPIFVFPSHRTLLCEAQSPFYQK